MFSAITEMSLPVCPVLCGTPLCLCYFPVSQSWEHPCRESQRHLEGEDVKEEVSELAGPGPSASPEL